MQNLKIVHENNIILKGNERSPKTTTTTTIFSGGTAGFRNFRGFRTFVFFFLARKIYFRRLNRLNPRGQLFNGPAPVDDKYVGNVYKERVIRFKVKGKF